MEIRQEEDILPSRPILRVGLIVIAVTIACSLWAWWLTRAYFGALRPSGLWPERDLPAPTEVNDIEQYDYDLPSEASRQRRATSSRLEGWGWIDREAGTVYMPIERAIDFYVDSQGGTP